MYKFEFGRLGIILFLKSYSKRLHHKHLCVCNILRKVHVSPLNYYLILNSQLYQCPISNYQNILMFPLRPTIRQINILFPNILFC
jgi:hypothetical protein